MIATTNVEALCEKRMPPLRFDEAQQGIAEVNLLFSNRNLRRHKLEWGKWRFLYGDVSTQKKGQPKLAFLFAVGANR